MKIIGITGQASSGKDTVAEYLEKKHLFKHISLSDLIRDYISEHNLGESTRPKMKEVGDNLRQTMGPDALARIALAKNTDDNLVISAVRHPEEALTIKKHGGEIWSVVSKLETRYDRTLQRNRTGDQLSYAEFLEQEQKEQQNKTEYELNLAKTIGLADRTIHNDGTLEDLYQTINTILKE
ncbi:AAA family ATPase [candidate division WWE3 bacterium]|uniref:AAA family ATPase n=1 Tax=candidate division WWE3 bacterium TaxID=2053526 RepID=A0A955LGA8_UNCKA|nr:AAA family ATPase [candidate division WWE3 bacterium]